MSAPDDILVAAYRLSVASLVPLVLAMVPPINRPAAVLLTLISPPEIKFKEERLIAPGAVRVMVPAELMAPIEEIPLVPPPDVIVTFPVVVVINAASWVVPDSEAKDTLLLAVMVLVEL